MEMMPRLNTIYHMDEWENQRPLNYVDCGQFIRHEKWLGQNYFHLFYKDLEKHTLTIEQKSS